MRTSTPMCRRRCIRSPVSRCGPIAQTRRRGRGHHGRPRRRLGPLAASLRPAAWHASAAALAQLTRRRDAADAAERPRSLHEADNLAMHPLSLDTVAWRAVERHRRHDLAGFRRPRPRRRHDDPSRWRLHRRLRQPQPRPARRRRTRPCRREPAPGGSRGLGAELEDLVICNQTHGRDVRVVTASNVLVARRPSKRPRRHRRPRHDEPGRRARHDGGGLCADRPVLAASPSCGRRAFGLARNHSSGTAAAVEAMVALGARPTTSSQPSALPSTRTITRWAQR